MDLIDDGMIDIIIKIVVVIIGVCSFIIACYLMGCALNSKDHIKEPKPIRLPVPPKRVKKVVVVIVRVGSGDPIILLGDSFERKDGRWSLWRDGRLIVNSNYEVEEFTIDWKNDL
jgi:hypothetical protein